MRGMAGDPVVYGDATHPEVLRALGLDQASVVVISFADPDMALRIVRAVRQPARPTCRCWCAREDDTQLEALQAAGATEVVPDIFETSLSLVSHVLLFLRVPAEEVHRDDRADPARALRDPAQCLPASRCAAADERRTSRAQQLHTVVLPPGAQAVDRPIRDLGLDRGPSSSARSGAKASPAAIRPETLLRAGDVLVLWGAPEDIERVEGRLLMG